MEMVKHFLYASSKSLVDGLRQTLTIYGRIMYINNELYYIVMTYFGYNHRQGGSGDDYFIGFRRFAVGKCFTSRSAGGQHRGGVGSEIAGDSAERVRLRSALLGPTRSAAVAVHGEEEEERSERQVVQGEGHEKVVVVAPIDIRVTRMDYGLPDRARRTMVLYNQYCTYVIICKKKKKIMRSHRFSWTLFLIFFFFSLYPSLKKNVTVFYNTTTLYIYDVITINGHYNCLRQVTDRIRLLK